ncbi:hypothetical protein DV735_g830, partial [Chaetothyriales sp. CBS 134920]
MTMEKIVKGGTKIKLAAPKSKYVEPILAATTGGESGVAEVFRTLQLRLRDSTWTIVFKSLIIVHLMIREGQPEVTLRYLADSPKRLALSTFTEMQTQGINIRRYSEYLLERVKAYRDCKTDFVQSGVGRMKALTVERGLLRQTESVQDQVRALVRCDFLGSHDPDNEITLTAFRLLTMDLLELFKVMNEGTINVLEHYFEMSRPDAERALNIYKTFGKLTEQVVQYLSLARQYESSTRLQVPKLKHAPTTLTSSLEDYLNDPDFEINRRQYLAQQEAKRSGRPIPAPAPVSAPPAAVTRAAPAQQNAVNAGTQPTAAVVARGPAPDLIDFFESIEQNQTTLGQQPQQPPQLQQPQFTAAFAQTQQFPQAYQVPQQTGFNPFVQPQITQQPLPSQPQLAPVQTDFSGAAFATYTPQQPPQTQHFQYSSPLSTIPSNGSPVQSPLQPQHTSTNPFRQSVPPPGAASPATIQSTNPFAKSEPNPLTQQAAPAPSFFNPTSPGATASTSPFAAAPQPHSASTPSAAPLQAQRTGTNPFAKSLSPPPATQPLVASPTGSTNPFRQSAFVNQQTGLGWQHTNQGTLFGLDVNAVPTTQVFPRPGANTHAG